LANPVSIQLFRFEAFSFPLKSSDGSLPLFPHSLSPLNKTNPKKHIKDISKNATYQKHATKTYIENDVTGF
jgi:hypothetical protein